MLKKALTALEGIHMLPLVCRMQFKQAVHHRRPFMGEGMNGSLWRGSNGRVGVADEVLVGVSPAMGTGRRPSQQEPGPALANSRHRNGPGGRPLLEGSDETPIRPMHSRDDMADLGQVRRKV